MSFKKRGREGEWLSLKKERERGRMVIIEKREGERENGYH